MKTVKIKMLRTLFVSGELAEKDKVVEVSEKDAAYLVPKGKAILAPEKAEKKDK